MRSYVEGVARGSILTSRSQITTFQTWCRATRRTVSPLFGTYYELRTYYFASTMTPTQKYAFEEFMISQNHVNIVGSRDGLLDLGVVPWCWLPGLHDFKGQDCVAMRFMVPWRRPEIEERFYNKKSYATRIENVLATFDAALQKAGLIDFESLHCTFTAGACEMIKVF